MVLCLTFHFMKMCSPCSNLLQLLNFIEVYGNDGYDDIVSTKTLYFMAVRFKQPIKIFNSIPQTLPTDSILLLDKQIPMEDVPKNSIVFFNNKSNKKHIGKAELLISLFPRDCILHSVFEYETLFVVSSSNPFYFTAKCNKGLAFSALMTLAQDCLIYYESLNISHVINLRFFKSITTLKTFSSWTPLAQSLFRKLNTKKYTFYPIPQIGKTAYDLLKRSEKFEPGPLPPDDFYTCEIMFETDTPLGILFLMTSTYQLEYVSPMVVSRPTGTIRDVNGIVCTHWYPLFQNKNRWLTAGCFYYLHSFEWCQYFIRLILSWLKMKNSEKYNLIYMDLINVGKLLMGKDIKWYNV